MARVKISESPPCMMASRGLRFEGQSGNGPGMPGAWNMALKSFTMLAGVSPAAVGSASWHAPRVESSTRRMAPPAAPPDGVLNLSREIRICFKAVAPSPWRLKQVPADCPASARTPSMI